MQTKNGYSLVQHIESLINVRQLLEFMIEGVFRDLLKVNTKGFNHIRMLGKYWVLAYGSC